MTRAMAPPPDTLSARIERGDVSAATCPSREILKHITSLWGVLVLIALQGKTMRFSELRRTASGISEKMLAQTLRQLERDGLVSRTAYPVVPPHVDYSLTALGQAAAPLVAALADWVELHFEDITAAQAAYDEVGKRPAP